MSLHNTKTINNPVKAVLFILFVVFSVIIFLLLQNRKQHSHDQHLNLISKRYQLAYNTIYDQYQQLAENLNTGLVERYDVQELYQQLQGADLQLKNKLRVELLARIEQQYVYLQERLQVKQLQFHLANNESFLRLHWPDRFGDDLTEVRPTVAYVNREHLPISGFEEGRFYSGYRFVFPITSATGVHLGSMEVSFGPEVLITALMKQYDILSNFFMKAEVSQRRLFAGELKGLYTTSSYEDYFYDNKVLAVLKKRSSQKIDNLKPGKKTARIVYANAHTDTPKSMYAPVLNAVITTVPVVNPLTKEMEAFLTIRSKTSFFKQDSKHYKIVFLLCLVLLASGLFAFYLQYSRKKILAEINNSLEEKVLERTKQLQLSKEEWEKTFDAIPDIITLLDKNMRIIRANQAAFDTFKIKPNELLGMTCHSLFRFKSRPCKNCPCQLSFSDPGKHYATLEHEFLGKFFQVTSAPILDDNNEVQYVVNIAQDISDKHLMEKDLLQAQKREAIGTLAGGIAHDFNNILAAILGYAEIIKLESPITKKQAEYLNQLIIAVGRATKLVKQILTFSRSKSQTTEALQIDTVVKEALKMLRASLPTTIKIRLDIGKETGLVLADPTNIHQIIVNLCTNASTAIGKENGILEVSLGRIILGPEQVAGKPNVVPGKFVVLSVKDTGKGMDAQTMERIFEPYYTTQHHGKGSGLGLAVTSGIVEKCNGFVTVDSVLGEGTIFQVFLPSIGKAESPGQATEETTPLPTGDERILIVDDEPAITTVIGIQLKRLGYHVTQKISSTEALELFKAAPHSYDLVITDQTMPDLTGYELAQAISKIRPNFPIILCTGYTASVTANEIYQVGIKSFLTKPLSERDLAETVRQLLDENTTV